MKDTHKTEITIQGSSHINLIVNNVLYEIFESGKIEIDN